MSKFEELDALIVSTVRGGKSRFSEIVAVSEVERLAKQLCSKDRWGNIHHDRLVDSRLQSLRRAGSLTYSPKTGWALGAAHVDAEAIEEGQAGAAGYVARHLPELCQDLLHIKATGVRCRPPVRGRPAVLALADMLTNVPTPDRFDVARRLIETAALERVASSGDNVAVAGAS